MNNSTSRIENFGSQEFDISDSAFKIVFTDADHPHDNFADRIRIFCDGDTSNYNQSNVISSNWFEETYDYESFLEDYGLIHRLYQDKLKSQESDSIKGSAQRLAEIDELAGRLISFKLECDDLFELLFEMVNSLKKSVR
jgi:hypothetical protein